VHQPTDLEDFARRPRRVSCCTSTASPLLCLTRTYTSLHPLTVTYCPNTPHPQEIELFSQEEAARATQQLANLRTVTGGNKNVTVATIQEIGTNLMDALSMPLVGGSASSQRESFEEGDVHMHSVFSTRQNSSNNSNSALHAALVSSTMNSSSHGNNSSNSGVNQMHAQKVPTQSV
jgi:hypothetical protein